MFPWIKSIIAPNDSLHIDLFLSYFPRPLKDWCIFCVFSCLFFLAFVEILRRLYFVESPPSWQIRIRLSYSYSIPHILMTWRHKELGHQQLWYLSSSLGIFRFQHQNTHYSDVIMDAMTFQTTSLTIIYSTAYSGASQRKHQSSASLGFVRGIHRWLVNSPHKWPVTRKMFPFDDVIMRVNIFVHVNSRVANCFNGFIGQNLFAWSI